MLNPAFSASGLVIGSGDMLTWDGVIYCLTKTDHLVKAAVLTRLEELQLVDPCLADATHNMVSSTDVSVGYLNEKYTISDMALWSGQKRHYKCMHINKPVSLDS